MSSIPYGVPVEWERGRLREWGDPLSPRRTGREDFPHPALRKVSDRRHAQAVPFEDEPTTAIPFVGTAACRSFPRADGRAAGCAVPRGSRGVAVRRCCSPLTLPGKIG